MIDIFNTYISKEAIKNVVTTLKSGFINQGPQVEKLEKTLSEIGLINPVAVNSCTAALHMALEIIGVEGKEVVLPAQTFIATGLAVLMARGKPVFCDIGYDGNICIKDLHKKITSDTAAIICVHWAGNPCDLDEINSLNIPVIEDAAHAFGTSYNNKPVGLSDFGCFSFQAIKTVTSGDGGILCCRSNTDFKRARRMRWFGIDKDNLQRNEIGERVCTITNLGYKYNMNDIEASMVLGNLVNLQARLKRRREISNRYWTIKIDGFNPITHKVGSSHWLFNALVEKRANFVHKLKSHGIVASVVDRRIDKHPIFGKMSELPVQEIFDMSQVHIPVHENLSDDDVNHIIKVIKSGW